MLVPAGGASVIQALQPGQKTISRRHTFSCLAAIRDGSVIAQDSSSTGPFSWKSRYATGYNLVADVARTARLPTHAWLAGKRAARGKKIAGG